MKNPQLSKFTATISPAAVLHEVCFLFNPIFGNRETKSLASVFRKVTAIFNGHHPGYRPCNTEYHDLKHTHDVFLANARIIHGATVEGLIISKNMAHRGMVAALLHDIGYLQETNDEQGTGSKYTATHVTRSIEFTEKHGTELDLTDRDVRIIADMILCTDLAVDVADVDFESPEMALLGKMLGAADLIAQMADRSYLEKLLFLYNEFKEAGIGNYQSHLELLQKTVDFYGFVDNRLKTMLASSDRFLDSHFNFRWNVTPNPYRQSIDNQHAYLKSILGIPDSDPREHLRRTHFKVYTAVSDSDAQVMESKS